MTHRKQKIMKTKTAALIMALGLTLPAITFAQDSNQPKPPRPNRPPIGEPGPGGPRGNRDGGPDGEGQRPPPPPLVAVLDANHDGVIDEKEIAQASESLKKLDKNGDGKLTMDELRPPRPEGHGPGEGGDRPHRDGQRPPPRDQ